MAATNGARDGVGGATHRPEASVIRFSTKDLNGVASTANPSPANCGSFQRDNNKG